MKRLLLGLGAILLLGGAVAWSGTRPTTPELDFKAEKRNPVTHLALNNAKADFQFAIVSDRTGGHRARVFARAVEQLNLLQPEFVMSVGDLIEGYSTDVARLEREWREFQGYVNRLQMPFFYVPGNHDLTNPTQEKLWREKFGRRSYEFVYRDVLFLALNSEDPADKDPEGRISAEQLGWIKKTIAARAGVRWTLVFMHRPMWRADVEKNGWGEVEKALKGRRYTVFVGHHHRYQKFVRQGQNYYQLATTGGGSKLRGAEYGELDHVVWVTMKKGGPLLANIALNGVLREDLKPIVAEEEGAPRYHRRPTHPAKARVRFEGKPVAGAYVVFQSLGKEDRPARADGMAGADGTVQLSTYVANDGLPVGKYAITVVWRRPLFTAEGKPGPNLLPPRYADSKTSSLEATIKAGPNEIDLNLAK